MAEETKNDWECSVECLSNIGNDKELLPNRHFLLIGAELGENTINMDTCIVRGNNLSVLNLLFKAGASNKALADLIVAASFELRSASQELRDVETKLKDALITSNAKILKEQIESENKDVESSEG
jgi:hypothetical protein